MTGLRPATPLSRVQKQPQACKGAGKEWGYSNAKIRPPLRLSAPSQKLIESITGFQNEYQTNS
jgi:hypothetical protein